MANQVKVMRSWPPSSTHDHVQHLTTLAITYALAHSLILKPAVPSLDSAIHAPFALLPSPFPRVEFEKALRYANLTYLETGERN